MKRRLFYTFGLVVLVMVVFAASSGEAASGVGPYYASPSWDEKLVCTSKTSCPRFEVLTNWNNEAVLDKETGLIWEESPSISPFTWEKAQLQCNLLTTGGRLGWRLPTLQELASLLDPTQSGPALPKGHPFKNVANSFYWSANTSATDNTSAWEINIGSAYIQSGRGKSASDLCWCVRGGQGVDPQ